ncbi:MAG: phosphatase PAP2 family protein [Rubrivivax sp.]|nr:phosphatase PAP2 family protein [Rubrivivax sp.]
MLIEFLADLAKLGFFVAGAYWVLGAYVRRRRPDWAAHLTRRRLAVLGALTLVMVSIKLVEDVAAQESGPVDTAILWFVRDQVPAALAGFFGAVTQSGSAAFLLPASVISVLALLLARRRFEALLLGASVLTSTLLVYALKSLVGRARPALWPSDWYWGSSFPSGHTLSTAAFATAAALCLARIWPRSATLATAAALLWTGLVALSRLVLGVHWPSDVLAALCLGVFLPLLFSVVFDRESAGHR